MIDGILRAGGYFDWISPMVAIAQDVANGPSRTFSIPRECGWTGREIQQLLRRYGITTWALTIVEDTFIITVRQTQADFAEYLLERAGLLAKFSSAKPQERPSGIGALLRDLAEMRIF